MAAVLAVSVRARRVSPSPSTATWCRPTSFSVPRAFMRSEISWTSDWVGSICRHCFRASHLCRSFGPPNMDRSFSNWVTAMSAAMSCRPPERSGCREGKRGASASAAAQSRQCTVRAAQACMVGSWGDAWLTSDTRAHKVVVSRFVMLGGGGGGGRCSNASGPKATCTPMLCRASATSLPTCPDGKYSAILGGCHLHALHGAWATAMSSSTCCFRPLPCPLLPSFLSQ
mmetsp:Transcript_18601/g.52291  ORF Transcript_18601/g.52291 Transcript_18601/m.52291 type:complete len:228 (+) Transcript_18601:1020-1703(+)